MKMYERIAGKKKRYKIEDMPGEVLALYYCAAGGIPVGASRYEKAIEDYPEWFPEEVEHKRKYALIQEEVHDAYFKELGEIWTKYHAMLPVNGGILWQIEHPEDTRWDEVYKAIRPEWDREEKECREKHYKKYGI